MEQQSLLKQYTALVAFEKFLQKFQYQIDIELKHYNDKIQHLRLDGVPVEICEKYQNHYAQPKIVQLKHLTQKINETELQFIKKVIKEMEVALNTAK